MAADGAPEATDLVVRPGVADLDGEVARGHRLGGDGELGGGSGDPARQVPVHGEEQPSEEHEQHGRRPGQRHPRRAVGRGERLDGLVGDQPPPAAIGAGGDDTLRARLEHARRSLRSGCGWLRSR